MRPEAPTATLKITMRLLDDGLDPVWRFQFLDPDQCETTEEEMNRRLQCERVARAQAYHRARVTIDRRHAMSFPRRVVDPNGRWG